MTQRPHYLDMTDFFKKACWSDGRFAALNRFDKQVYQSPRFED